MANVQLSISKEQAMRAVISELKSEYDVEIGGEMPIHDLKDAINRLAKDVYFNNKEHNND